MCKSKSRETGNLSTRNIDDPRNAASEEFKYTCNQGGGLYILWKY